MMTRADYAVVGDLHEVLPALIKALAGARGLGEIIAWCDSSGCRWCGRCPHPARGFTQGLIAAGDTVWESGGQYGMSVLRRYELGAAEVAAEAALPPDLFAEGICRVGGSIWQLTWQERVALRWDAATLRGRGEGPVQPGGLGDLRGSARVPDGARAGPVARW